MTRQYIAIEKYGPSGALKLREGPVRSPGDDDVAIDVAYSGINFADIMMRLSFYPDAPKRPFIPGYEVAGLVAEAGRNVEGFRPGDPVAAGTYFRYW
jgi:NADPH:quinone reductase-like Zn-dependent oxidoreductase